MSCLSDRLSELKARRETALVCYLMAGDPTLERSVEIALALANAGVDALEIGVPFSDPLADGPSIQEAGQRALAQHTNIPRVFEMAGRIRAASCIPIVLMTYYNPALRYGLDRFAADAASAGADAVIQTDLTPEESDDWLKAARKHQLDTVYLVAPTSTAARIRIVTALSTGFVYCVSRTGVTGAKSDIPEELPALVENIRKATKIPVCVGFGVSEPKHVKMIGEFADGVVVGSATVNIIAKYGDSRETVDKVAEFATRMKSATRA